MSKLRFFLTFCFLSLLFFKFPDSAFAATCELTTVPTQITIPNDKINPADQIQYFIKVADKGSTDKYDVVLQEGGILGFGFVGWTSAVPNPTTGILSTGDNKPLIQYVSDFGGRGIFQEGNHQIIVKRLGSEYCTLTYTITKDLPNNQKITCSIFGPQSPNSGSDIRLNGTILPPGTYRFNMPNVGTSGKIIGPFPTDPTTGSFDQDIGQLNPGSYQILLQTQTSMTGPEGTAFSFADTNCLIDSLTVESTEANPTPPPTRIQLGSGEKGSGIVTAAKFCTAEQIRLGTCSSAGGQQNPACPTGLITAIGCIETSPTGFIKNILTFIIGISGGLAFLMMLLGAFQMLTSAGNPETLNAGRERLTSAVIGLLFVVFAMLLLQIIGFGILNIPGFGA